MRRQQPDRVPIYIRGVQPHDARWVESKDSSFAPLIDAVGQGQGMPCPYTGDLRSGVSLGGGVFLTAVGAPTAAEVPVSQQREPAGDWDLVTTTYHTLAGALVGKHRESPQGHPGMVAEFPVKTEQDVARAASG
jgi:hypothetical protein